MVSLKEKIKAHHALSKNLTGEYKKTYEEIIVYLRTSRLIDVDAEEAVGDILTMLLEGQERKTDIHNILGSDIKDFCDNIISSYGNHDKRQRLRQNIQIILLSLIISTFFSYVNIELPKILNNSQSWVTFNISVAMLLMIFILSISSYILATFFINGHFEKDIKKRKKVERKETINFALFFIFIVASLVVIERLLGNTILFTTQVYWIILILILLFLLYRFLQPKV
ncbi:hypothetical protein SH2C18_44650 [Clostridium sediminicola]|uniref:DUF1048 domain-containing protein n=1 Tax=Clostridium sediminicola TaxID=3114879 RepID=UPI0031F23DD2